jgi:hypothetical protein
MHTHSHSAWGREWAWRTDDPEPVQAVLGHGLDGCLERGFIGAEVLVERLCTSDERCVCDECIGGSGWGAPHVRRCTYHSLALQCDELAHRELQSGKQLIAQALERATAQREREPQRQGEAQKALK